MVRKVKAGSSLRPSLKKMKPPAISATIMK